MSHQDWRVKNAPLVLDASVVINLVASGHGCAVLSAIGRPVIVPEVVAGELDIGVNSGRQDGEVLARWVTDGNVSKDGLTDAAWAYFEQLVSGSGPESLEDGEAATIALAHDRDAIAVLDERKAVRLCEARLPTLLHVSTVDLLLHPNVTVQLGEDTLIDALFNALTLARMRVFPHHQQKVADLLGPARLVHCNSLPLSMRQTVKS